MSSTNSGTQGRALLAGVVAIVLSLLVSAGIAKADSGLSFVTSASVDFTAGTYGQITIVGQSLPTSPVVALDGTVLGTVSSSPTQIVASLQNVAGIQNHPGDYLLTISQGGWVHAVFVATIGAAGPAGPQGGRRRNGASIGIAATNRVGVAAFGAMGVE